MIVAIARRDVRYIPLLSTLSYSQSHCVYVDVNPSTVFALATAIVPRDVRLLPALPAASFDAQWQFVSRSLSAAVHSCVTGFVKGRDETSLSRARLLCLQVRENLRVVR